jgi:hypothetical protein
MAKGLPPALCCHTSGAAETSSPWARSLGALRQPRNDKKNAQRITTPKRAFAKPRPIVLIA